MLPSTTFRCCIWWSSISYVVISHQHRTSYVESPTTISGVSNQHLSLLRGCHWQSFDHRSSLSPSITLSHRLWSSLLSSLIVFHYRHHHPPLAIISGISCLCQTSTDVIDNLTIAIFLSIEGIFSHCHLLFVVHRPCSIGNRHYVTRQVTVVELTQLPQKKKERKLIKPT